MDQQSRQPISADDLAVTLAVRQELGPAADSAVIAEFLDRVGPAIDVRVEERLAATPAPSGRHGGSLPLAMASLGLGIPISAIALSAGEGGGVVALLVAWSGIVGVNWAFGRK